MDLDTAVQEYLHEADEPRVVNLDPRHAGVADADRQGEPLEHGEIDRVQFPIFLTYGAEVGP
jgi:hypothetical protein